jgi:hypothetical protein
MRTGIHDRLMYFLTRKKRESAAERLLGWGAWIECTSSTPEKTQTRARQKEGQGKELID